MREDSEAAKETNTKPDTSGSLWPIWGASALIVLAVLAVGLWNQWHLIFDDAFISYRYSRNLANGLGLTWNLSDGPVEGYTNLLLVLLLVPAIKLGWDPYLTTRVLNLVVLLAMAWVFRSLLIRWYDAEKMIANLIALVFLCCGGGTLVALLGLETILFACTMFLSLLALVRFLKEQSASMLAWFGCLQCISFLLRPEAFLLTVAFFCWFVFRRSLISLSFMRVVSILFLTTFLPFSLFLLWKQYYFSSVLPLPFYIKAQSLQLYSPIGLESILRYVESVYGLLILVLLALFDKKSQTLGWIKQTREIIGIFTGLFLLFYIRVDTLQDQFQRFLYPLTAFLFLISLPVLLRIFRKIIASRYHILLKVLVVLCVLLASLPNPRELLVQTSYALRGTHIYKNRRHLMRVEYRVAQRLREYKHSKDVSIAFGDAGVIAYYVDSYFLDTVGLNDAFIAKERDLNKLVAYLFRQKPVMIIVPTMHSWRLLRGGHGPLGDWYRWSHHPQCRWQDYVYVGTTFSSFYHLSFLIRSDFKHFQQLKDYLQKRIVDTKAPFFPLPVKF